MDFIFYILTRRVYSSRELTRISWLLDGSQVEQVHHLCHVKVCEKTVLMIDPTYCFLNENKADNTYPTLTDVLLVQLDPSLPDNLFFQSMRESLTVGKEKSFKRFFFWGHTHISWNGKASPQSYALRLQEELSRLKLKQQTKDLIFNFLKQANDKNEEKEFHLISDGVLLGFFIKQGLESKGLVLSLQNLNLDSFYMWQQTPDMCVLTCEKVP